MACNSVPEYMKKVEVHADTIFLGWECNTHSHRPQARLYEELERVRHYLDPNSEQKVAT